jgi:integrating conjugative element protein (TIGR03746 family)
MAYIDALAEAQRQIRQRNTVILSLGALLAVALIGWQAKQNDISVHVRPGLTASVTAKPNEMPSENVFNFALTLMMQIYRWRDEAKVDYKKNVDGLHVYMTDKCRLYLLEDAKQRENSGELSQRTRVWEPLPESYYSAERVQAIDGNTWLVTIDASIRESVRGETVKDGYFRYQIFVETTAADRDVNPYGLQFNCFAPNSPTRLEPTKKEIKP